jgi:hypothetical protein
VDVILTDQLEDAGLSERAFRRSLEAGQAKLDAVAPKVTDQLLERGDPRSVDV